MELAAIEGLLSGLDFSSSVYSNDESGIVIYNKGKKPTLGRVVLTEQALVFLPKKSDFLGKMADGILAKIASPALSLSVLAGTIAKGAIKNREKELEKLFQKLSHPYGFIIPNDKISSAELKGSSVVFETEVPEYASFHIGFTGGVASMDEPNVLATKIARIKGWAPPVIKNTTYRIQGIFYLVGGIALFICSRTFELSLFGFRIPTVLLWGSILVVIFGLLHIIKPTFFHPEK